jgi:thiamine biosynthesis lipoprotein
MRRQVFGISFEAMASRCEIKLAATDEAHARRLAQAAIEEVRRIEYKYSRFRSDSLVSRINSAAGSEWVECDAETVSLFGYADALFQASDGLFDITSGVLRRAWNFREAKLPSEEQLTPLRALIGWRRVQREESRFRLPQAGMEIDFGGFGKEYAADRAAAILSAHEVEYGYINLGGDMNIIGPQPDGRPWQIGIQDPRKQVGVIAGIPVSSGALTTSGDYERFFELEGKRFCHILDPRSGQPVRHWRSVSVLAPLAVAAGSCATIAMLKQEDALRFLDGTGMAYLAVDEQGVLHSKNIPVHK